MAKTIWLIWDGASYAVLNDLLRRGLLPHLQRVRQRGYFLATAPPGPNSETPPGLMTLFTGVEEPTHGVAGFTAPLLPPASLADTVSGFAPCWLRHPPVWVDAVACGRSVALSSIAFAPDPLGQTPYPWRFPLPGYRYLMDGYNHEVAKPQLLPLQGKVTPLTLAHYHLSVRQEGRHRVVYRDSEPVVTLRPFQHPQDLGMLWLDMAMGLGVGLAWLPGLPSTAGEPEEQEWLWCSALWQLTTWPAHSWPVKLGPFFGGGIGWHYGRGLLGKGPRIPLAIMQALTCRVAQFFGEVALHTVQQHAADFTLLYQPAIDEISHQVMQTALDDWPYGEAAQALIAVYQAVDTQLGGLLDRLDEETTVLLSSDHGQEPIRHCLRPNVLLQQAGLVAMQGDKVDLERTKALFHSSGWVLLNTTARQGGIVPPEAYAATLREVEQCLERATDPLTQRSLGFKHSRTLWQGPAPAPGDLFVWGPPETELRPHLTGPVYDLPEVQGHHQTCLHPSPYLQAFFAGCGPGIRASLLPERNAQVARLVRHALDLPEAAL